MFDKIKEEMITAMKNKDKKRLAVIKMVKASCDKIRIDNKCELTDDVVYDVLLKQLKMREDSLKSFKDANRTDLISEVESEIEVLKEFLPPALSKEEVEELIDKTIEEVSASSIKDMGKVMGLVSPKVKARYDQKEVSTMIREKLSK